MICRKAPPSLVSVVVRFDRLLSAGTLPQFGVSARVEIGRISADGFEPTAPRGSARTSAPGTETPRTFTAKRARQMEAARKRRRKNTAIGIGLAAAVIVPTVAAQAPWDDISFALGFSDDDGTVKPMPFEVAGQSFPGSAFYYVEDAPRVSYSLDELRKDEGKLETVEFAKTHGAGATAQAFRSAGTGLDKARALQCLSMAVYYEAASESYDGQRAVAQVVLNRVAHPAYPASVCGVVFQGSERKTGCQFTFTCDGALARKPSRAGWARAQSVALAALAGQVYGPVGLATHYHTHYVNPYWASSLNYIGSIGAHRFYVWKGKAGTAGAFTNAYSGFEPSAMPNPRAPDIGGTAPAPVSGSFVPPPNSALGVGKVPDVPVGSAAPAASNTASAPAAPKAHDTLPASGGVKPQYERSGQWIRQPGQ